MMAPPGTFERVYAAIRQRLREGLYRPGERLEPALLSDELNTSVTPVRDAFHRLTGERLVEASKHQGFRAPMMSEPLLRHLYGWHRDLLLMAVMKRQPTSPSMLVEAHDSTGELAAHDRQSRLFLELAQATGNPEHAAALEASATGSSRPAGWNISSSRTPGPRPTRS